MSRIQDSVDESTCFDSGGSLRLLVTRPWGTRRGHGAKVKNLHVKVKAQGQDFMVTAQRQTLL